MGSAKSKFEYLSENLLAKSYITIIINLVLTINDNIELINPSFHLILEIHFEQIEVIVKKQLSVFNFRHQTVFDSTE